MCRQVSLIDLRTALSAYCEDEVQGGRRLADDLLDEFEESSQHAVAHEARAMALATAGDDEAAAIHRALSANMARAAFDA